MINSLVADLPEVYQPIYGHPELSRHVSRTSLDRLEHIARIHDAIQRLLGRPLKVLDLGCAQGYFSFNLAERGATVHGVDYLDKNIAVCNALAGENATLQVSFETGRIEDVITRLEPSQYDLVLGLSVLHHIVHEKGVAVVQALLGRAAAQCGALVLELALREEPLYWGPAQPEDPRSLLQSMPFVHEVARHSTHLAQIPRPLFVASNHYWIFQQQAARFEDWSINPHSLANNTHEGSRRYFSSLNTVAKMYRLDHARRGTLNKTEFEREVAFLQDPPANFHASTLLAHGNNASEAWVVMERLPGRLLLDVLREGSLTDPHAVLLAVLEQLVELESVNLFHNDVRTWNVLVAEDGAVHLIDYGSITPVAQDCVWPGNPFFAFFIFVREVFTGEIDDPDPLRTIAITPLRLPPRYQEWATALWNRPLTEWSFRLMHQTLLNGVDDGDSCPSSNNPQGVWMQVIEEAIQTQKHFSQHVRAGLNAVQTELRAFGETAVASAQQAITSANKASSVAQQAVASADNAFNVAQQAIASADNATSVAQQAIASADNATSVVQQANAFADNASFVAQQAFAEATQARESVVKLEAMLQTLQHLTTIRDQRVTDLLNSTSWRVTAPLRWLSIGMRRAIAAPWRIFKFATRSLLLPPMRVVLGRPRLRQAFSTVLKRFPTVAHHLHLMAIKRGVVQSQATPITPTPPPTECSPEPVSPETNEPTKASDYPLTPHARQILDDLKRVIERSRPDDNT